MSLNGKVVETVLTDVLIDAGRRRPGKLLGGMALELIPVCLAPGPCDRELVFTEPGHRYWAFEKKMERDLDYLLPQHVSTLTYSTLSSATPLLLLSPESSNLGH